MTVLAVCATTGGRVGGELGVPREVGGHRAARGCGAPPRRASRGGGVGRDRVVEARRPTARPVTSVDDARTTSVSSRLTRTGRYAAGIQRSPSGPIGTAARARPRGTGLVESLADRVVALAR